MAHGHAVEVVGEARRPSQMLVTGACARYLQGSCDVSIITRGLRLRDEGICAALVLPVVVVVGVRGSFAGREYRWLVRVQFGDSGALGGSSRGGEDL